jgi:hypothetical protein
MHWCMDETLALLSVIPFIGYFFAKLHSWYHGKFHHKCHEKGCEAQHMVHDVDPKPGEYWSLNDTGWPDGQRPEHSWDNILQADLVERYGEGLITSLYEELQHHLGFTNVREDTLHWQINDLGQFKVRVRGRSFVGDNFSRTHGWHEVDSVLVNL